MPNSASVTADDPATAPRGVRRIAVAARRVGMIFSGQAAVDDVSFDLREGAFLTILGPSGSGKTTLLRMIAGFERPTTGEILIHGVPVAQVPAHRRSIGMVFQRLALFPHMSVEENVAFPLKMRRFDARTIPARVERYLDLVRLGGFGRRRVHELSGGQQQRVAIARALVFEPDLLLLDEPLAALDRKLREEMQLEFRRIQRELGVTTINVTHDQREALVVSDEIIVMDGGRIQQMARPSSTYREPGNAFVAGFIGVTNFVAGRAGATAEGRIEVAAEGLSLVGRPGATRPPAPGDGVTAALRAEQIRIAVTPERLAGLDTITAGEVTDVVFEGERVVYEVRPDAAGLPLLRVFDHDPAEHAEFAVGARAFLGWNARDLIVFKT